MLDEGASITMTDYTDYEVISYSGLKPRLGICYSRAQIDRFEDPEDPCYDPTFPKSFKLGKGPRARRVWWLKDMIAWLKAKAAAGQAVT
jgi:predicted DNA-binding transcriptional regulator AlpA